MRKFNGIPRQHFHLFLKGCEWRLNTGTPMDLLVDLKKLLIGELLGVSPKKLYQIMGIWHIGNR